MKIYIYSRVSTEDQNVDQQVKFIQEWAKKNNHIVLKILKDTQSGRTPLEKRYLFQKMIQEIKDEPCKAEAVVIYSLDRLTRNWDDINQIEIGFRQNWNKCRLMSTSEDINLESPSGRLMFRIKMAVACYMPEEMLQKQRIGIERAKEEGKYQGGKKGRTWKKQ